MPLVLVSASESELSDESNEPKSRPCFLHLPQQQQKQQHKSIDLDRERFLILLSVKK